MKLVDAVLRRFKQRRQAREQAALTELKARYHAFRVFLENNGRALESIVAVDGLLHRAEPADVRAAVETFIEVSGEMVDGLNLLAADRYAVLYALHGRLAEQIDADLRNLGQIALARAACIGLDQLEPTAPLQAGAKAVHLARLRQMGLPVPNGFVCTVRACKNFLRGGQLAERLRHLLHEAEIGRLAVPAAATRIRELVLAAPLPPDMVIAVTSAYRHLAEAEGDDATTSLAVSVRSSGAAEDGIEHSFAGQFTTLLNVRGEEALLAACRQVIASGFSARAIAYRINAGLPPFDFDLAVLVQIMVAAETAGVLFTVDPSLPESGRMLISAVPGLGTTAVGGAAPADLYRPLRATPQDRSLIVAEWVDMHIARKTQREVPDPAGGLRREAVAGAEADQPLLSRPLLAQLVEIGRTIEELEGLPQDVEWACVQGRLHILQARPLRLAAGSGQRPQAPHPAAPLGTGFCASSGKAVGRARLVRSVAELHRLEERLPETIVEGPLILVLPHSIVDAARLLPHCAGILVDMGNPTDHLACVAREHAVPMVTGMQTGLADLHDRQWLMVDADHGLVVAAPESVRQQVLSSPRRQTGRPEPAASPALALSPARHNLRERIVALNLTDAYGPTFSLAECRSLHDIVRYAHEMAVLTMFSAGDQVIEDAGGLLRPMDIGVPFSFLVIDLGGGIRRATPRTGRKRLSLRRTLGRDDVLSAPLAALCDGMTTPGLRWHVPADLGALPEILSRTMHDQRGARPVGACNYALVARDYLNLNARVECHFAMVDAVCGRDSHANYIRFRFKGGGAGLARSHRRALFLQQVLERNGFYTTVAGDLVTASLSGAGRERIAGQLAMVGRLFGFSRFLDGAMRDDEVPLRLAEAFLAGQYDSLVALAAMENAQA